MTPLIETTSPLYAKRIIREINSIRMSGHSVYAVREPFNVRVRAVTFGQHINKIIATDYTGKTFAMDADGFMDDNGQQVCATRKA